jgi:hypothetical protein
MELVQVLVVVSILALRINLVKDRIQRAHNPISTETETLAEPARASIQIAEFVPLEG